MRWNKTLPQPPSVCRALLAALVCSAIALYSSPAAAGQTAADIVENPILLSPPNTGNWDYQSRYLIENAYKSIKEKNFDNAKRLLDRVMEQHPLDIRTIQIAVYVAFQTEDWPEANRLLSKWLSLQPEATAALVRRGYVRSKMERFRESLADFEEVVNRDPSPLLKEYVEQALASVEDRWLDQKAEMDREWNALHPELAAMDREKRWADLERAAAAFIARWPDSAEAHFTLGLAHLEQRRPAQAEVELAVAGTLTTTPALKTAIADAMATIVAGDASRREKRPETEQSAAIATVPDRHPDTPVTTLPADADGGGASIGIATPGATLPPPAPPESEWDKMLKAEAELRRRQDWAGLEKLYGEEIQKPEHAAYARMSRAYLLFSLGRHQEARADFAAAVASDVGDPERAAARDMLAIIDKELAAGADARAWARMREEEKALSDSQDWARLEAFYDRLIDKGENAGYAYQSRAYLRHSQGRLDEARADFETSLTTDIDQQGRTAATEMIARIDAELLAEAENRQLAAQAETLAAGGNWEGVERLYDERLAANPNDAHALAMRGFARLDRGLVDEAETDFAAALALGPDENTRNRIEETQKRFQQNRAEGVAIGSPRVEEILGQIGQLVGDRRFADAAALLPRLGRFRLNEDQTGRLDFFTGEVLWTESRQGEAYRHYAAALPRLPREGYYRSEALWKMGDYHLKQGDRQTAVSYIQQAIAAMPEAEWRYIQAGYAYSGMAMDREAVDSFEQARRLGTLREDEADFYHVLARAYRNLGERELFHSYMRRQIDIDTAKVAAEPRDETIAALYDLRRDYNNLSKRIGGHQFVFGDRYEHKDYMSQYQNEINFQFRITRDIRAEAYFQTIATIASRFSGTYFDTWSGIDRPYSGQSNLHDGINAVVGVRVYPFAKLSGLSLALDQVLRIGRETANDTRLHVGYYDAIGNDWNPVRCNWTFASLWADAIYSLRRDDFTLRSEGRLGRSFRADRLGDKVVITPYLGLIAGYGGKNTPKSERTFLEGGPGVMFRKYFHEDKYHAPRQSVDLILQYRIGMTHNRSNALSVMLFHSF